MASPSRSSPSARDAVLTVGLGLAAILVGAVGWSGEPRALPLAFAFPALWSLAPSRVVAAIVSTGYFLAASRGLPQGVVNFYGSGFGAGIGLWIAAALGFVIVQAVLWSARPGWGSAARYGVAAVLMSVPPFGIVGWAHPVTAAGILFPGWGWWGLAAAAIGLLAMTARIRPIAILTLGGFWIWSSATWTEPNPPEGWIGVDTNFGGAQGEHAGYAQHLETIALVRSAVDAGYDVVVLPEGAAGIWTPTVEAFWLRGLEESGATVNAGAIVVGRLGYDNVMMEIASEGARVLYRERMPVPVSMWQPWLELTGEGGGARSDFFANPIVESAGLQVAPLICYEQLLIWPILQSALHGPDVIVATGNGWWTHGTSIVAIQKAASIAWARLFDLPLVMAFNT